jgi:integrase
LTHDHKLVVDRFGTATHYVFPREIYKQPKNTNRGASPYTSHPSIPVATVNRAWKTARLKAGWILAGRPESTKGVQPLACRFHDLRHTAVTRMINAGIPIPIIAQLVGWSTSTMIAMASRYGHHSQEALRTAVESISGAGSPVFSPVYGPKRVVEN